MTSYINMKYYFYKYLPGDYVRFLDLYRTEHEGFISAYFLGEFVDKFYKGHLYYQILSPTFGILEVSENDLSSRITYHSRSRKARIPNNNLCSICTIGKCSGELCSDCENKSTYDNKYFYLNDIVSVKLSDNKSSKRCKFRITGASMIYSGNQLNFDREEGGLYSSFLSWKYWNPDFSDVVGIVESYLEICKDHDPSIYMDYYSREANLSRDQISMAPALKINRTNLYHRLGSTIFPGIDMCDRCVFNNCSECGIKTLISRFI